MGAVSGSTARQRPEDLGALGRTRLWIPIHLSQPDVNCGEFDEAGVGFGELVVSGRYASELFEFAEEAFDAVARRGQGLVVAVLVLAR